MDLILLSPLEKVMQNEIPKDDGFKGFSMLSDERKSFQLFISSSESEVRLDIDSDIYGISVYTVEYVPSGCAVNEKTADDYVVKSSDGLYPDLLLPVCGNVKIKNSKRLLWLEIVPEVSLTAGSHHIDITVAGSESKESVSVFVDVIDCMLEKQSLIYTNWFHTDCLTDEYNVDVFSNEYWRIVENYLKTAAEHGMNCVLTPLFTPPIDTAVGGERPTVQLVDVNVADGEYSFNFDKLVKWIGIAQKCGIEYFEMPHFFTQWGAKSTPKITANVNGKYKKLFGWKTPSFSPEYKNFLVQFSKELKKVIESLNLKNKTLIHVSDEPNMSHYPTYRYASRLIRQLFDGYKIIDALSDYKFYSKGLIETPVASVDHITPFIGNVPELWTYYCSAQDSRYVSNRFFSIPPQRNRVLGFQLYKYNVKGFLHWGFNFWYTRNSKEKIDPFKVTDAGGAFQSGDSFVVYPAENGTAYASTRLKVFYDALQDMRVLQTLERLIGREKTLAVLEEGLTSELTFFEYPHSDKWLLETRQRINEQIKNNIHR